MKNKIIINGIKVAIKLVLAYEKRLFNRCRENSLYYANMGYEEEAMGFAEDAMKLGNGMLQDRSFLDSEYASNLEKSLKVIDNHKEILQDKINKTQVYYRFSR